MRREQFDHLVRAVGHILDRTEVVVIGSQSVLGAFPDLERFPEPLVRSVEVDFLPMPDPDEALADRIDAFIGELSPFHQTHGVYGEGVGERTAKLPPAWQERLLRYRNEATSGVTALCLEPHDLAVSKLIAGRPQDYEFCGALVSAGLVDPKVVGSRLVSTGDVDPLVRSTIVSWLAARGGS
jgi:hypothetical protein